MPDDSIEPYRGLGVEAKWFLTNLRELEKQYPGAQYLLIRNCRVVLAGPCREPIYQEAFRRFGPKFYLATVGIPRPPLEAVDEI